MDRADEGLVRELKQTLGTVREVYRSMGVEVWQSSFARYCGVDRRVIRGAVENRHVPPATAALLKGRAEEFLARAAGYRKLENHVD